MAGQCWDNDLLEGRGRRASPAFRPFASRPSTNNRRNHMATKQYEVTVYLPDSHSIKVVVAGANHVEALRAARAMYPNASSFSAAREI